MNYNPHGFFCEVNRFIGFCGIPGVRFLVEFPWFLRGEAVEPKAFGGKGSAEVGVSAFNGLLFLSCLLFAFVLFLAFAVFLLHFGLLCILALLGCFFVSFFGSLLFLVFFFL